MKIMGFAAQSATGPLEQFVFERRAPRPVDVVIDILFCGVCHADLHLARNHGGFTTYPIIPGHEIIGRVREVRTGVSRFKVGDMVGVGCMVDSCQHCKPCLKGWQQNCVKGSTYTYNSIERQDSNVNYGGYSASIVVRDKFVLSMPNRLDLAAAAPPLCAGITTWSPLHRWNVRKDSKVAVVGLGGLGHMALNLAKALGADVTLFTRSAGKEEDAFRLDADHVVLSGDPEQMKAVAGRFDVIIDTVPYDHDVNPLHADADAGRRARTRRLHGAARRAGGCRRGRARPPRYLRFLHRRRIRNQQMLVFCGEHGIVCDVEVIPVQKINGAYERMLKK